MMDNCKQTNCLSTKQNNTKNIPVLLVVAMVALMVALLAVTMVSTKRKIINEQFTEIWRKVSEQNKT